MTLQKVLSNVHLMRIGDIGKGVLNAVGTVLPSKFPEKYVEALRKSRRIPVRSSNWAKRILPCEKGLQWFAFALRTCI